MVRRTAVFHLLVAGAALFCVYLFSRRRTQVQAELWHSPREPEDLVIPTDTRSLASFLRAGSNPASGLYPDVTAVVLN
ncbi:hypothetical protein K503DRAFT_85514 [Rhizopogon vinicolor AM-OR11-026]|uniref:Uncharacterized protein n=1 Tax=Rhizopogon vinicolor AM-OR11-026 TaxID=1314800 RepID=A0A1B7N3H6_9AGAM|nr:hypothetical protein K503DRAFT_85514 [Rhizopogon vinicolor AM-OR11-026]